jgi:L-malate glycosyltransferase
VRAVHQLVPNLAVGDAISQQVITLRAMLRRLGFASEIFAQHVHSTLTHEARPAKEIRSIDPEAVLVYHFSIGSEVTDLYRLLPNRRVLVYHNITPHEFFRGVNEKVAALCARGREELAALRPTAAMALADSEFNRRELVELGYMKTAVLPIVLDPARFAHEPVAKLERPYRDGHVNFLHVGRIVPNKKLEDVLKVFWFYRRKINPDSRLFLVGIDTDTEIYSFALRELVDELALPGVVFAGGVTPRELVSYYRLAHVYLCMSEHEGFCAPLVEAMHFGVPVVAYSAGAVPETVAGGAIVVREKRFAEIAEIVNMLLEDDAFRALLVERGKQRAASFTADALLPRLRELLPEIIGG